MRYLLPLFFLLLASCSQNDLYQRESISLQGQWQFALDTADTGIQQGWYASTLPDTVRLPGTTDTNQKGFLNTDTTSSHLNRKYKYVGPAWYRKKITVPQEFSNKHLRLYFERTKPSKVWVDTTFVGSSKLLQSPQKFDVTKVLGAGEHFITIRVDNRKELTPYGGAHIYAEDTQTNWNGIIGKMKLQAMPQTYISNLQAYPDIEGKKVDIKLGIENRPELDTAEVKLIVEKTVDGTTKRLPTKTVERSLKSEMQLAYKLGDTAELWDEYQQPLYRLTVVINHMSGKDSKTIPFGMREFAPDGTQFQINGRTTFLRGNHNAAVFPETGYTPTDVQSWAELFRTAKSYGINHYRFHTYTPPEAAFTAADRVGIYLQAELPFWGGLDSDSLAAMLRAEGKAMLKEYANHPSFVMFSHGNEIWSGHDRVEENLKAFKAYDDRPLYTMGSNNSIGYAEPREVSEYFVGSRTPYRKDSILTHTRLTHAYVDSRQGGMLNSLNPSTEIDYSYSVNQMDIPVVSHEIGQYQIYPDYEEIGKYDGVLRPWNLMQFRDSLNSAGMPDQDSLFQKASGAWAARCYKAEMEAALRTPGFGGFRLLDLQDYPGQGTALVGILDAFMDPKGVISREEWLESCNDVVLLMEFPKYTWSSKETFRAEVKVANYSNRALEGSLQWSIKNQDGHILREGAFSQSPIEYGGLSSLGKIEMDLSEVQQPRKLTAHVATDDGRYTNDYPIWVYPPADDGEVTGSDNIMIKNQLDAEMRQRLQQGGKVLLFPRTEDVKDNSVPGLFPPNFWNYEMFKTISQNNNKPYSPGTLSLLTNPEHPIFNSFPTEFHTNWQWFDIIKAGNSLFLNQTADSYRPIVQVIDNLQRNYKMGLIFEFKVGSGKLLVCMSRLDTLQDEPEAVQLYQSMVNYMNSDSFDPEYEVDWKKLNKLL